MSKLTNVDRWDADCYKSNSDSQFTIGMGVVTSLHFGADETVLDIGCGDGRLTAEVAKRVFKGTTLGIDISPNMIQEAQKTFGSSPNLSFECIDATKFDTKNRFDRVLSFHTFHWIDDQSTALKKIASALKPAGHLHIVMLPSTSNPITDVMESPKWASLIQPKKPYFKTQSPATIKALMEEVGFVNIKAEIKRNDRVFKNLKDLHGWLMGWVPHATGLVGEKALELVQDIAQVAEEHDGKLVCVGDSLHVEAQKPE